MLFTSPSLARLTPAHLGVSVVGGAPLLVAAHPRVLQQGPDAADPLPLIVFVVRLQRVRLTLLHLAERHLEEHFACKQKLYPAFASLSKNFDILFAMLQQLNRWGKTVPDYKAQKETDERGWKMSFLLLAVVLVEKALRKDPALLCASSSSTSDVIGIGVRYTWRCEGSVSNTGHS